MVELTNTRQWKDEPIIDYINRWRALSLNCRDKLSEASTIEMCIQDMHWGLIYILQGIKPINFSIVNHKSKFSVGHLKKESTKDDDFSELAAKGLMTPIKFPPNERRSEKLQSQHMPHYEGWPALDNEDTAGTNVPSILHQYDIHILENKQKGLPSPPAVPPKFG
ncbi:UNVERIFIED_CONTAM: hypothetical protein Sradi_5277100 [Sesamum radiatum]|uniref:Uncharacterized protein n=1 Tax=Sesamum radiatum TaxID=300843 RepID=A0AAW2LR28_SESRA